MQAITTIGLDNGEPARLIRGDEGEHLAHIVGLANPLERLHAEDGLVPSSVLPADVWRNYKPDKYVIAVRGQLRSRQRTSPIRTGARAAPSAVE
jgi:hypothetical protein